MNKILNDFIEKLRTNQKLQYEFKKCKTLKQSYDRFMKGKCSYEEYEDFFEDLIKRKAQLSDQDLEQVCGGISLKKMLAPITIVTMLTGSGAILANNVMSSGQNSIFSSFSQSVEKNNVETICDGQIQFSAGNDSIVLKGVDEQNPAKLDISNDLSSKLKFHKNKTLKIGAGIESIKLEDQDIDISCALDLKSVDLGENNSKYKIVDSSLWAIDEDGNLSKNLGFINKSIIYDFCFDRIDELPKLEGNQEFENLGQEEDFRAFLALPNRDQLKEKREYVIYKPNQKKTDKDDSLTNKTTINEKKVYDDIQNVVWELTEKVEKRTPPDGMSENDIQSGIKENKYSKNYKMNKYWRIAKAIYRWVAKNISYDDDSLVESCRKPQDPLFVFQSKTGVCAGFSNLTNLMMRMAGIPSLKVSTLKNQNSDKTVHGYTAIYLPSNQNSNDALGDSVFKSKEAGWALLDSTWGATGDSTKKEVESKSNINKKDRLKENFPGFYSQNSSLKDDNKKILDFKSHKISHFSSGLSNVQDSPLYNKDFTNFSRGNLEFTLGGSVQEPTICIKARKGQQIKNLKISDIPQSLLKYGYSIEITNGIESLTIDKDDDIKLKISDSCQLKTANASPENKKYFADEIAIWEKNSNNEPEKLVKVFRQNGVCGKNQNQVKYSIEEDKISLEGKNINTQKLPHSLKLISQKFNKPFQTN